MARDMEKQIKELKKQNSYLLDRLDKAYNDKMLLRQESMKSKKTVKTVKNVDLENGKI